MKRSYYFGALSTSIIVVIAGGATVTSNQRELLAVHRITGIFLGILMLGMVRFGWAGWAARTCLTGHCHSDRNRRAAGD